MGSPADWSASLYTALAILHQIVDGLEGALITEVRLTPVNLGKASTYLEAEVVGNINGLLSLEPVYADTIGSGGWI